MKHHACAFAMASLVVITGHAAVSADEAKQLGGPVLTPMGAEKSGNKEGTIPAYDPKLISAPAGWDRKTMGYPDPWNEKPLYSITAKNAAQYADKIDGMADVFKKYPNFRMDVYPSHRHITFPKYVIDNTLKNATVCKGAQDGLKLEGCVYGGLPFPIPKTGREEMWNHLLSYGAFAATTNHLSTYVTPSSGQPVVESVLDMVTQYPYYDPAKAGRPVGDNDLFYTVRADFIGPARQVGTKLVLTYFVDQMKGSRIFQYVPGQRRVKLAPDLAYDTPAPTSGGTSTMDEQSGFLGALDRYDFKLVGKKEKLIQYDNFTLTDPKTCPDMKVASTVNFANPDCVRWEPHRVWVVEAKLRPGYRHIYPRRMFFWDEDTHGAGSSENYDAAGKLYRAVNLISFPYYGEGSDSHSEIVMDMQTGLWSLEGGMGGDGAAWYPGPKKEDVFFSPEALAGEGVR